MDWLIQPLEGFGQIGVLQQEQCSTHYSCSCQGGLCVCTVEGALKVVVQR
jgi:hypothetical protein